ncbi:hypothetical protein C7B67_00070 [filamentous cyanobacterium Phorm 6]|nr:hypothetical protein C7B67_00070 [filamentous cyanobacterium Phorm 6]
MKPEVARRRIEAFEKRFGRTHLIFACHAAFPLALTPDLLYKLWANFQRDIHGFVLGIPWVAVADLLLSSLCDEVGRELYEMDTAVRNSLLNRLKENENFGQQRINELSDFLLVYVRQQLQSNDQEVRDFAQAQRWTALAYVRPTEAAQELRAMLEQAYKQDKSEQLRLVSLVEAFAEPLVEFEPLLVLVNEIRKGKSEDDNKPNKQDSKKITNVPSGYYAFKPKPIVEKLALLTFVGDVDNGFNVLLEISLEGDIPFIKQRGRLPLASEIIDRYQKWQFLYRMNQNLVRLEPNAAVQTNFSRDDLQIAAQLLQEALNNWLKSKLFHPIQDALIKNLSGSNRVRVIIKAEDNLLRRLPWHLWDILDHFPQSEVALSARVTEPAKKLYSSRLKARILALLVDTKSIDVELERKTIEKLDAEIEFMVEPSKENLYKKLWDEKGWDIFLFAGHGLRTVDVETGILRINPQESLTISELKDGFKPSIERGLQLGIFNTCEGVGLGKAEFGDLGIPHIITMRDLVSDVLAQHFLEYFIGAFSKGMSLYLSVKQAREMLQKLEGVNPCASWLPVIVQHPAATPPTWSDLSAHFSTLRTKIKDKEILKAAISALGIKVKINDYVRGSKNIRTQADIVAVLEGDCDLGWCQNSDGSFDLVADLWGVSKNYDQTLLINAINWRYGFYIFKQKEPNNYDRLKDYLKSVLQRGILQEEQEVIIYTAAWLQAHTEDFDVRQQYLKLVEKCGTVEQQNDALSQTAAWLQEHPNNLEIREQYLAIVKKLGIPEQEQKELSVSSPTHSFRVGQVLEAKVTSIKGNKVTYEIVGTIKLTEKEPKNSKYLLENQIVQVKVIQLKEDGTLKKVKKLD